MSSNQIKFKHMLCISIYITFRWIRSLTFLESGFTWHSDVTLNKAHFYCSSMESSQRTECGKPEEADSQTPRATIDQDHCPEGTEDKWEHDFKNWWFLTVILAIPLLPKVGSPYHCLALQLQVL